jgi:HSP20 family protein
MPRAPQSTALAHPGAAGGVALRDPLWDMQRRINSEFERFWQNPWALADPRSTFGNLEQTMSSLVPPMDVRDTGDSLVVHCELPGIRKEDVNIELQEGNLTISGKRENAVERRDGDRYMYQERQWGTFQRTVALPENCKPEDVKASFQDGVLEVNITKPKMPQQNVHRIQLS